MVRFFDNKIVTNPGSSKHALYKPVVNEDGVIDLEVCGYEDTNELIQSYAESCDISIILANCANGDLSGLNAMKGVYGDFTEMPKTYAEMLQLQIDAKRTFDSLPVDVKNNFNNDVNQFLAVAGEKEWAKKLGLNVEEKGENSALDNNVPKAEE